MTRTSGPDRYATAATLAQVAFAGAADVHLATGVDYPDALAGGPAAALGPGPLLLAQPGCVPDTAQAQITRLAPARLVLLGGTSALGAGVEQGTVCATGAGPLATGSVVPDTTPITFCPARASGAGGSQGHHWLQAGGLVTVQVAWVDSWLMSAPGEEAGHGALACRPATALRWAHDTLYAPLGLGEVAYRCGFCATGNSGVASQVSYALSHYGLDTVLDAVVPTGGPPHADLVKGCLRVVGQEAYWFGEGDDDLYGGLDGAYGFSSAGGPCQRHDQSYVARWTAQSIATGGSDYIHPDTRVHFVQGTDDRTVSPAQGGAYADRLRAAGSRRVTVQVVNSGHSVQRDPEGAAAIVVTLLAS